MHRNAHTLKGKILQLADCRTGTATTPSWCRKLKKKFRWFNSGIYPSCIMDGSEAAGQKCHNPCNWRSWIPCWALWLLLKTGVVEGIGLLKTVLCNKSWSLPRLLHNSRIKWIQITGMCWSWCVFLWSFLISLIFHFIDYLYWLSLVYSSLFRIAFFLNYSSWVWT